MLVTYYCWSLTTAIDIRYFTEDMKLYLLALITITSWGICSTTSLPDDPYLASDGRYGKDAANLALMLTKDLSNRACTNDNTRKCFHNDWKRRDKYCTGSLYGTRFSFKPWYGGTCYCCARCYPNNKDLCYWNDWAERDANCKGYLYDTRYSFIGPEGKKCYCCSPR